MQNWFYKLELLINLLKYRSLFARKQYSKNKEDQYLKKIFKNKIKGTYIDIGAYHPYRFSNTYLLYRKGWRGINVDMDDIKVQGFNILRPKDINICSAVTDSSDKKSLTMYSFGLYSLVNSLDKKFADKISNGMSKYTEKEVNCSTLNKILEDHAISKVDILSIDAEGHDINVLQSIDLLRYSVNTIIVEEHTKYIEEILESEIYEYLTNRGYSLVNWTGPSLIFQIRNS